MVETGRRIDRWPLTPSSSTMEPDSRDEDAVVILESKGCPVRCSKLNCFERLAIDRTGPSYRSRFEAR